MIKKNLQTLGLHGAARIFQRDASEIVPRLSKWGETFGLVFVDPPHNKGLIKKTLHQLDLSDIVRPLGIIVVGHSNRENLPEQFKSFSFHRSLSIGQSVMSFLVRKEKD